MRTVVRTRHSLDHEAISSKRADVSNAFACEDLKQGGVKKPLPTLGHHALLALACIVLATPALADDPQGPVLRITGQASAKVTPDRAVLTVAVVTERPRSTDALADNARAVAKAMTVVRAAGIPDKDVRTSHLSLTPINDTPKTGEPKIVAFRVHDEMAIEMPLSADVGGLSAKLVENGVNAIENLALTVSDETGARDGLRAAAARDARRQAEIYANALGVKLGRVLDVAPGELDNSSYDDPHRRFTPRRLAAQTLSASLPALPVSAGEQTLEERVTVLFEIVQ